MAYAVLPLWRERWSHSAQLVGILDLFQLKKKKLEQRSKLENLEDLEKIIQLKKKKKCKKVKVPITKEPEPEVIVSYFKVPSSGEALMGVCTTRIYTLYISFHQTGPVDVPMFFRAALENKLPVIEKYLSDKGDPNVCDEVQSSFLLQSLLQKRGYYRAKITFTARFCSFHAFEEKKGWGESK